MKMDRESVFPQAAQRGEELFHLLWRQHSSRLVKDQDFGVAIERFEDFHARR